MQDLSPRRIRKCLEDQIHISILSKIPNDVKRDRGKRRNWLTLDFARAPIGVSFGSGPGIDPIGNQEQKAQIALGTTVFFGGLYLGLVKVGA